MKKFIVFSFISGIAALFILAGCETGTGTDTEKDCDTLKITVTDTLLDTLIVPDTTLDTIIIPDTLTDTLIVSDTIIDTAIVNDTLFDTLIVTDTLAGWSYVEGIAIIQGAADHRGITVTLLQQETANIMASIVTDSSGRYSIADLPTGSYTIGASASGYLPDTGSVTITRYDSILVDSLILEDIPLRDMYAVWNNGPDSIIGFNFDLTDAVVRSKPQECNNLENYLAVGPDSLIYQLCGDSLYRMSDMTGSDLQSVHVPLSNTNDIDIADDGTIYIYANLDKESNWYRLATAETFGDTWTVSDVPAEVQSPNLEIELDADENLYFLNGRILYQVAGNSVSNLLHIHADSLGLPGIDGYTPTGAFSIDRETGAVYIYLADKIPDIDAKGMILKIDDISGSNPAAADVGIHGYGGGAFLYVSPGGYDLVFNYNTDGHRMGHISGISGSEITVSRELGNLNHASGLR